MFKKTSVEQIFPTPLWIADLEPAPAARLNRDLKAAILALIEPRAEIPRGTNWQTEPVLQDRPEFADFTTLVTKAAHGAMSTMRLRPAELVLTGMWGNVNPPGGLNSEHTHPNNYLSGVYYVDVPAGAKAIRFSDPRPQAQVVLPPVVGGNAFNSNDLIVDAQAGRLVMFPSWLCHSVPVNRSEHDRISIAFNFMFARFGEEMAVPLWKGSGAKPRA